MPLLQFPNNFSQKVFYGVPHNQISMEMDNRGEVPQILKLLFSKNFLDEIMISSLRIELTFGQKSCLPFTKLIF